MRYGLYVLTMGLLNILIACNTSKPTTTNPPTSPTNFVAITTSSTAIRLSWTAPSGATGYVLERRTGSGGSYTQIATPTASPYDDTALNPSTEYGYRLKARNSTGSSTEVETSAITPATGGGGSNKIGAINISESNGVGFASAFFVGTDQTLPQPPSGLYGGSGTCAVSKTATPPIVPDRPDPSAGLNPTSLDAGPEINIKSGSDPYATLHREVDNATVSYQATNLAPLPASATVDIPGAAGGFPAFSNIAMPDIPTDFDFTATPSLDAINKDSTFSWTNPLGSAAQMLFVGFEQLSETEFIGFVCVAPDTGSFAFPALTKAELDAVAFAKGQLFLAVRQSSRTEVKDTTYLVLSASRGKLLSSFPGQITTGK